MNNPKEKHIFIIGSKGIPAKYGGYETFVEHLTKNRKSPLIVYHVACLANNNDRFTYNSADCFNVRIPNFGSAKAVFFDKKAFGRCLKYIKENKIQTPIIYVLTCRIGPWFPFLVKKLHKLGGRVFLNPDGHEWMRAKWSKPVRTYWKLSEREMVKNSDLIICDSKNIEEYIKGKYNTYHPKTTFIPYGSDISPSPILDSDAIFVNWLEKNGLISEKYFLCVGRFVPENNFETMIREFMLSKTTKSFVIVTNFNTSFFKKLDKKLHFNIDNRIKFVGTIYNENLLKKVREKAFAYIHGHSVGGTNPSLLEALSYTKINLLFDVSFNREVAEDSALYWTKQKNCLSNLIDRTDHFSSSTISDFQRKAKKRIVDYYNWDSIINKYEELELTYE